MEYPAVEESEVDSELITDDDDSDSSAEEVSSSDQGWIITMVNPESFCALSFFNNFLSVPERPLKQNSVCRLQLS